MSDSLLSVAAARTGPLLRRGGNCSLLLSEGSLVDTAITSTSTSTHQLEEAFNSSILRNQFNSSAEDFNFFNSLVPSKEGSLVKLLFGSSIVFKRRLVNSHIISQFKGGLMINSMEAW